MNKIKVLVIDDNNALVDMVKQYFSSHAVIEVSDVANNGKDGLSLLENNNYDLVLLDLIMPGMDGVKLLEEAIKKEIKARFIVLTSYNSPEVIRKVSGLGIKYFMLKPFELSDLEEKILEYSNNEVYFYDLNKIIKYDEIGNKKDDKNEIKEEKEDKTIT